MTNGRKMQYVYLPFYDISLNFLICSSQFYTLPFVDALANKYARLSYERFC